jgi:hypothetical protein
MFDYELAFKEVTDKIVGKIARSKLKGLRNAYSNGVDAANTYGDFLKARHTGETDAETAVLLSEPFGQYYGNGKGNHFNDNYAKFFDVLDILDFISKTGEGDAQ